MPRLIALHVSGLGLVAALAMSGDVQLRAQAVAPAPATSPAGAPDVSPVLSGLKWRSLGPARGGRSIAVAGHPDRPLEYYFGATGGGLWKTSNGGTTWTPIADKYLKTSSVGAVAVAPSNGDVVYAGMGEVQLRGNVIQGDGVYRTTDGGKTWTHLGLEKTMAVARIRVHPINPDVVWVAALGHPYGPNPERGVFRSGDGGKTWERTLFRNERTGAVDLVLDPSNPDVLYAGDVGSVPHSALTLERRTGERAVQVHGWRYDLDRADAPDGSPQGRGRQGGRVGFWRRSQPCLRHHRGRGRWRVRVRRCG